jgi:hypothetical protein
LEINPALPLLVWMSGSLLSINKNLDMACGTRIWI